MGEKHSKNKAKGITLIALIITIIVMLILVGVSVSILINSNLIGIAENAGNKTKTAYNQEANMGEITIGDSTYNSIDKYMQTKCTHNYVNGTCSVCGATQPLDATLIASATDKTAYYGKTVNYTCGDTAVGWRIFYAGVTPGDTTNTNNIYLIADDYIAWDNIGETLQGLLYKHATYRSSFRNVVSNANYTDGTESTRFTNSPAKNWLKYARSTSIDNGDGYTSKAKNMMAVAMMLDTTVWTQYCNSAYADYAIGGPTLDMFVASWNQTQTTKLYYISKANSYGYLIDTNTDSWDDWDYYTESFSESNSTMELYFRKMGMFDNTLWLASPSAYLGDRMFTAYVYNGCSINNSCQVNTSQPGFRPIVKLSNAVKLTTDSSIAGSCDFGLI